MMTHSYTSPSPVTFFPSLLHRVVCLSTQSFHFSINKPIVFFHISPLIREMTVMFWYVLKRVCNLHSNGTDYGLGFVKG